MKTVIEVLGSIPWSSLGTVFLLAANLLLVLIAWRLNTTSRRYIKAIEVLASTENEQTTIIERQISLIGRNTKALSNMVDLEYVKFLDQLESYYQSKPDKITRRFGLQTVRDEEHFKTHLSSALLVLSSKVFDEIIYNTGATDG